ncbi:MAG: hypothetical protein P8184_02990 [Calditrichia bacterium]
MSTFKKKRRRNKPVKVHPEQQLLFDELCEVLQKLGVEVRSELGQFNGGYCIIEGKDYFFLNKSLLIEQNIDILLEQLKSMELGNVYLSPKLRECLEDNQIAIEEQK